MRQRRMEFTHVGIDRLGSPYHGPPGVAVAKVVAVQSHGGGDWAAYVESETTREKGNTTEDIASWGNKLPATAATEIFPEWAKQLPYRD